MKQQLQKTVRVRISMKDMIGGCLRMSCRCGKIQYITDEDTDIPDVWACECGVPFAYIDEFRQVWLIGDLVWKGVDRRV